MFSAVVQAPSRHHKLFKSGLKIFSKQVTRRKGGKKFNVRTRREKDGGWV